MTFRIHAVLAATLLFSSAALAQSTPDAGQHVEPGKPALLEPAKQAMIRERVSKEGLAPAMMAEPAAIGMVVPMSVTLHALPEDTMTELPTVTAYRFFLAGDRIAIVDPNSRQVVQLIDK